MHGHYGPVFHGPFPHSLLRHLAMFLSHFVFEFFYTLLSYVLHDMNANKSYGGNRNAGVIWAVGWKSYITRNV